ncbi:LacI family DNA-binding transcriptional regulator [Nocardioides albertanoniae]|nr:LacI family DNA-binding transcriptional regulator [Nocardioides albertanoniae]
MPDPSDTLTTQLRTPAMADVARLAGVSAQTVSRALRDHPHVQPATRAKVLDAVRQLGYRRNNAARALSSGRSHTIGVVMHQTAAYSSGSFSLGVERAAREAGYAISTVTAASVSPEAVEAALAQVIDQGVDGLVLTLPMIGTTPRIDELTRDLPTVATDGSRTPDAEVVAIDQRQIGALATQHLLDLGHETVWHVAGQAAWLESVRREEGWRATLVDAGREPPPILTGDWSAASGYQAGLILGRIPEASAVFVAGDEMAFGLLRALHELGRTVPDDISVVGVDDIRLAAYATPPLTTVAQPFDQVGAAAVNHLIGLIDGVSEPPSIESPPDPRLIIRSTTAQRSRQHPTTEGDPR